MTTTVLSTKISKVENITFDNSKYITTQEFSNLNFYSKLNSLVTKDYFFNNNFFSGIIYFTSNDGYHNTFVYQPTLDTLELKKMTIYILSLKSNGLYTYKLNSL